MVYLYIYIIMEYHLTSSNIYFTIYSAGMWHEKTSFFPAHYSSEAPRGLPAWPSAPRCVALSAPWRPPPAPSWPPPRPRLPRLRRWRGRPAGHGGAAPGRHPFQVGDDEDIYMYDENRLDRFFEGFYWDWHLAGWVSKNNLELLLVLWWL